MEVPWDAMYKVGKDALDLNDDDELDSEDLQIAYVFPPCLFVPIFFFFFFFFLWVLWSECMVSPPFFSYDRNG